MVTDSDGQGRDRATRTAAVRLSLREARRIALAAQGFGRRPTGRVDRRHFRRVLDQVATVQIDSVNVLTRSHELVFMARLGPYDREALTRWLWTTGEVFEYWGHEASLHPVERHPYLRWRMADDHRWGGIRSAADEHPEQVARLRQVVADKGPIGIGDLQALNGDRRRGESWWGWSTTKRLIEHLFWKGEVTAVRGNGFSRAYMDPRNWLPEEVLTTPTPSVDEARRELLMVSARAVGVGTARDLADYYRMPTTEAVRLLDGLVAEGRLLPATVEGRPRPAYLHPDAKRPRRVRGRALLSPFDSLIWERDRTERLWGFRYRIEIYVPAGKRVHGYYVLPFLLDDELVGRVDLKADRQVGVLRVRAAWLEERDHGRASDGADAEGTAHALADTLVEMADWLGLREGIEVEPRGTLAPALESALRSAI